MAINRAGAGSPLHQPQAPGAAGAPGNVQLPTEPVRVAGGGLPMKPSEYFQELIRLNPGVDPAVLQPLVHDWMKRHLPAKSG